MMRTTVLLLAVSLFAPGVCLAQQSLQEAFAAAQGFLPIPMPKKAVVREVKECKPEPGRVYLGGTPCFDETTGKRVPRRVSVDFVYDEGRSPFTPADPFVEVTALEDAGALVAVYRTHGRLQGKSLGEMKLEALDLSKVKEGDVLPRETLRRLFKVLLDVRFGPDARF